MKLLEYLYKGYIVAVVIFVVSALFAIFIKLAAIVFGGDQS